LWLLRTHDHNSLELTIMFSALPALAAGSLRRLGVVLALLGCLGALALAGAQPAAAFTYGHAASFESVNYPGHFMRHAYSLGEISPMRTDLDRHDATFFVRPGLANTAGVSFESANYPGYFLRHQGYRIKLAWNDGSALLAQDATFMPRTRSGGSAFESVNYPGHFIRHANWHLWLARHDGSALFNSDSTWRERLATNGTIGRGQCTDYALYRRPDLNGKVSGNAQEWTQAARNAGLAVSKTPSERAVMVFQAGAAVGYSKAGPVGHVAYVESVQRDAYGNPVSFVIWEQNSDGRLHPTTRTIQVRELPATGVDFIR
jgi:surface antigen